VALTGNPSSLCQLLIHFSFSFCQHSDYTGHLRGGSSQNFILAKSYSFASFFLIRLLQFQFSIEMEIRMWKCRIGKWDRVGQGSISESAESRYILLYSLLCSEDTYSSWQMSLIIRHIVLCILSGFLFFFFPSPIEPHMIRGEISASNSEEQN